MTTLFTGIISENVARMAIMFAEDRRIFTILCTLSKSGASSMSASLFARFSLCDAHPIKAELICLAMAGHTFVLSAVTKMTFSVVFPYVASVA